jgi:hypothetical protein
MRIFAGRRHLNAGQRAFVGLAFEKIEAGEAKERQGARTDLKAGNIKTNRSESRPAPQAAERAAEMHWLK